MDNATTEKKEGLSSSDDVQQLQILVAEDNHLNQFIINKNRARAAGGAIADFLIAGQGRHVAQGIQQRDTGFNGEFDRFAVDLESDGHAFGPHDFLLVDLIQLRGHGLHLGGSGDGGGGSECF